MIQASTAKKTELLALPMWGWDEPMQWYRSLLIVPSRKMHDSGFAHIAIIGEDSNGNAAHRLAMPDDIQWPAQSGISPSMPDYGALRTDCYWPSGVLRIWSNSYEFSVSTPVSSVDILLRRSL